MDLTKKKMRSRKQQGGSSDLCYWYAFFSHICADRLELEEKRKERMNAVVGELDEATKEEVMARFQNEEAKEVVQAHCFVFCIP